MTCLPPNPWEPVTSTLKGNPADSWRYKLRTLVLQDRPVRSGELLVSDARDQLLLSAWQHDRESGRMIREVEALEPLLVVDLAHFQALSLSALVVIGLDDVPLAESAPSPACRGRSVGQLQDENIIWEIELLEVDHLLANEDTPSLGLYQADEL